MNVANDTRWQPGASAFDHYLVERRLGEGGMGVVYLLGDRLLNRRYAVKRIREADVRVRLAFARELQVWADLPSHPNLVALQFIRNSGEAFAVFMEYAEHGCAVDWIARERRTPREIVRVAAEAARGLAAAHAVGIVHCDVKPHNILVMGSGVAKVSDFGLATTIEALRRGDRGHMFRGTPQYRSPEQTARRPLSPATDVWSFAGALLHLLLGQAAWLDGQVLSHVFTASLADRAELAEMPAGLLDVLRGSLLKAATKRLCMSEVAALLEAVLLELGGPELAAVTAVEAPLPASADDVMTASLWEKGREIFDGLPERTGSPRARAFLDIVLGHELAREWSASANVDHGALAGLYGLTSRIQEAIGDVVGATQSAAAALACHEADPVAADDERIPFLVRLAQLHHQLGQADRSRQIAERALALCDAQIRAGRMDLLFHGLDSLGAVVVALAATGDRNGAIDRQIRLAHMCHKLETQATSSSVNAEDAERSFAARWFAQLRAVCLTNLGCLFDDAGKVADAVALFGEARSMQERLVEDDPEPELIVQLANTCLEMAVLLAREDRNVESVGWSQRAVEELESLLQTGDERRGLVSTLARAYGTLARARGKLGELGAAASILESAIHLVEARVLEAGAREHIVQLALLYGSYGGVAEETAPADAVRYREREIALLEEASAHGGVEARRLLAVAHGNMALCLMKMGGAIPAIVHANDRCLVLFEEVATCEIKVDDDLAKAYVRRAQLIDQGAEGQPVEAWRRACHACSRAFSTAPRREIAMRYADTAHRMVELLGRTERYGEAREILEDLEGALAGWNGSEHDVLIKRLHADASRKIGLIFIQTGRVQLGVAAYARAAEILERAAFGDRDRDAYEQLRTLFDQMLKLATRLGDHDWSRRTLARRTLAERRAHDILG